MHRIPRHRASPSRAARDAPPLRKACAPTPLQAPRRPPDRFGGARPGARRRRAAGAATASPERAADTTSAVAPEHGHARIRERNGRRRATEAPSTRRSASPRPIPRSPTKRRWPTRATGSTFEPGGRVAIGFAPRAGDGWPIDGRAPRALPAGRATGRAMAASAQGSRWAKVRGSTRPGRAAGPCRPRRRHPTTPRRPTGRSPRSGRHAGRLRRRRRASASTLASRIGPPPPGLRLPALLGAERRLDQAQPRRALDDRLLLGRRDRDGRPQEEGPRTAATRRAGAAGRART